MSSKINKSYDDWNSHWDQFADSASRNPAQSYRHQLIINIIKKKFHSPNINILDVGSGQGDLLRKIANKFSGADLIGFELSASGIEISKKKIPGASFYEVDMFNPPPEIENFHSWATVVCCSEVLEHTDDPNLFLAQILPFISTKGMIIVTVPGGPMSSFDKFIGHRQHFTDEKLRELFISSGYTKPVIFKSGFPFHNLYKIVVILRGNRLKDDVSGMSKYMTGMVMSLFRVLFNFNFGNTAFGWQLIGIAYKP